MSKTLAQIFGNKEPSKEFVAWIQETKTMPKRFSKTKLKEVAINQILHMVDNAYMAFTDEIFIIDGKELTEAEIKELLEVTNRQVGRVYRCFGFEFDL